MRSVNIAPGEYYHLYNRGVRKQSIFREEKDHARFLFLMLYLQSPTTFTTTSYHVDKFHRLSETVKWGDFASVTPRTVTKIVSQRHVELVAFCLMQNHFHLCVREIDEGGIARYMQRVLMGYTRYFNTKYEMSGHVFQGPYQAVHQESNEQLLHLSAYIHRNPRELGRWKDREHLYPWSSLHDYTTENRWRNLLVTDIISEQFDSTEQYHHFVRTSPAKDAV